VYAYAIWPGDLLKISSSTQRAAGANQGVKRCHRVASLGSTRLSGVGRQDVCL
jgi:hypothetical protein